MKTLTHEWLKAANDDLLTIEHIIDEEHLSNIVAFHAEQTVEKCFKAVLEECGVEFPKTHDISRLYKLLEGFHHFEIDQEILLKVMIVLPLDVLLGQMTRGFIQLLSD